MSPSRLRLGILGASRIAPTAVVAPARRFDGVRVEAVASREPERAQSFAEAHGIERHCGDYDALLADPGLDAVYVGLPNSLHHRWTLRALAAGKHVLCEKPLASNAAEGREMAEAARASGRTLLEASHFLFHPMLARVRELVASGAVGAIRYIDCRLLLTFLLRIPADDIRYRYDLGGGATMDVGCYAIHLLRAITGLEPTVTAAEATLAEDEQVDRSMTAELSFHDPESDRRFGARLRVALCAFPWSSTTVVHGSRGRMEIVNPYAPQLRNSITLRGPDGKRSERLPRDKSSYDHQLEAFAEAVAAGDPMSAQLDSSVRNMQVIDAVYAQAGLRHRGGAC